MSSSASGMCTGQFCDVQVNDQKTGVRDGVPRTTRSRESRGQLATHPEGPFSLLFRVYGPKGKALDGTYVARKHRRT
jgi:hypothetical protein